MLEELLEEQEQNAADGVVDLLLNEQLDEQGFEAEEMSFAEELPTTSRPREDGFGPSFSHSSKRAKHEKGEHLRVLAGQAGHLSDTCRLVGYG